MKNVHLDPLGLLVAAKSGNTKVHGRLDLQNTSHCPICGSAMKPILAASIPSYICWEHRVVLPQPNVSAPTKVVVEGPTQFFVDQNTVPRAEVSPVKDAQFSTQK